MSDYTKAVNYAVKDGLLSGNPAKKILGTQLDTEFNNIATAVASKYDDTDLASQAEAEAGSSSTKLMTPQRTQQWGAANAGIVADLRALTAAGNDRILFWDESAAAAAYLTIGSGLSISGGDTLIASASGSVPSSRLVSTGTGLTGGGDLSADRTISLSHLGIQSLVDPNVDAAIVWDDSAGNTVFASFAEGVQNTASNNIKLDVNGLTAITSVDSAADYAVVYDATDSTHKKTLVSNLVAGALAVPVTKYLTTAEARTSTTTPSTVSDLSGWTLEAGAVYKIEGSLLLQCTSSSVDSRTKWTTSTAVLDSAIAYMGARHYTAATAGSGSANDSAISHTTETEVSHPVEGGSTGGDHLLVSGFIRQGASSATLNFQLAQNNSSGTTLNLLAGSWITVTKIS